MTFSDAVKVLREVAENPTLISMVALGGLSSLFIGAALGPPMPELAEGLDISEAGSGVTVGVLGGFIGLHWSLTSRALTLCIVALVLLVYTARASARAATSASAPPLRSTS